VLLVVLEPMIGWRGWRRGHLVVVTVVAPPPSSSSSSSLDKVAKPAVAHLRGRRRRRRRGLLLLLLELELRHREHHVLRRELRRAGLGVALLVLARV